MFLIFCLVFTLLPFFSSFCCLVSLDILKSPQNTLVYLYSEGDSSNNATAHAQLEALNALLERQQHNSIALVLQKSRFAKSVETILNKSAFSHLLAFDPESNCISIDPIESLKKLVFDDVFTPWEARLSLLKDTRKVPSKYIVDMKREISMLKMVLKQCNLDTKIVTVDFADHYFSSRTASPKRDHFSATIKELADCFLVLGLFAKITFHQVEKVVVIAPIDQNDAVKQLLLQQGYALAGHFGIQEAGPKDVRDIQSLPLEYIEYIESMPKNINNRRSGSNCLLM